MSPKGLVGKGRATRAKPTKHPGSARRPGRKAQERASRVEDLDKGIETRLIEAAIRCLERGGSISVSDVAREAECSRATAFRAFRQKDILEAVIQGRLEHIGVSVAAYVEACKTFEDAILLGILESVRHVRADRIFVRALTAAEYRGLTDLLVNSHARVMPIFEQVWGAWLLRARQSGRFPGLWTNQEMFEYLRSMQLFLLTSAQDDEAAGRFVHRMAGLVVRSMREG